MPIWISVFIGGGLGSIARWLLSSYFDHNDDSFPIGTFLANIIACLLLGLLIGYHFKNPMSHQCKLLLMTGFCGGFSTFSTFSAEMFALLKTGNMLLAFGYLTVSLMTGLVAVFLGIKFMG